LYQNVFLLSTVYKMIFKNFLKKKNLISKILIC